MEHHLLSFCYKITFKEQYFFYIIKGISSGAALNVFLSIVFITAYFENLFQTDVL